MTIVAVAAGAVIVCGTVFLWWLDRTEAGRKWDGRR